MSATHDRALEALSKRDRLRSLEAQRGIDFASNDYLGLAQSEELKAAALAALERGVPVGAGGSRLLRGNHDEHEALECAAAKYFRSEAALFFGGGFIANTAIFSTLPARGDLIVYDSLIHASAHDGMRASKAEARAANHNDPQSFDDVIKAWRSAGGTGQPWIAVESLYSMDGDKAPLDDLFTIAMRHEAVLVIDEAHATGVYGPDGRGLGAHLEGKSNVISLHTCGKALGVMGALVLAPKPVCDFLINRARAFIYATAPSPLVAATVRAALDICHEQPERRAALAKRVAHYHALRENYFGERGTTTQIDPIIVGRDARAVTYAKEMRALGFDIRAVRPPTVPEGTARLRISITLNPSDGDIERMVAALADISQRLPA